MNSLFLYNPVFSFSHTISQGSELSAQLGVTGPRGDRLSQSVWTCV